MTTRFSFLSRRRCRPLFFPHSFFIRKSFGSFSDGNDFDSKNLKKEYQFFLKKVNTLEDTIFFKLSLIDKFGEKKAHDIFLKIMDLVRLEIKARKSPLNPEDPQDTEDPKDPGDPQDPGDPKDL